MAEIVVEALEVIDVDQEHAERLVLFHRRDLRDAEELVERAAVWQSRQRVGPGALFGLVEGVANRVELAALLDKARFQFGRAGGGLRQLAHQALDQQFRIGPGLAGLGDVADGLDLRTVVGDRRGQKLLGRVHYRMQLLRRLIGCRLIGALRSDVGFEQAVVGGGVEFAFVADQDVDRSLEVGWHTQRIFEPDLKIVRCRGDPLLPHDAHGFFRDRRRVLEI